jgi:hypothetical protein
VVVSDSWLFVWSTPGDNAGLEDYLASTFQDTARFGTYRVLTRKLRLPSLVDQTLPGPGPRVPG